MGIPSSHTDRRTIQISPLIHNSSAHGLAVVSSHNPRGLVRTHATVRQIHQRQVGWYAPVRQTHQHQVKWVSDIDRKRWTPFTSGGERYRPQIVNFLYIRPSISATHFHLVLVVGLTVAWHTTVPYSYCGWFGVAN
jgi:hypothetical protein